MNWGALSRAERDAAYNNGDAVKDSATLHAARETASAAFRAAHPEHLDLRYGPRERNTWDLFPGRDPRAPCMVFIHGGYWQRNSKDQFANLIGGPYAHGWAGVLPGYTLAPNASMTEIVAEIRAALDWLAEHGPTHGIAGPIVLSGWSAGGHLTAMCLDHPSVVAGLAISGLFELGPIRDTDLNEKLRLTDTKSPRCRPFASRSCKRGWRLPMAPWNCRHWCVTAAICTSCGPHHMHPARSSLWRAPIISPSCTSCAMPMGN
jgi:acetyl esterase/lipase